MRHQVIGCGVIALALLGGVGAPAQAQDAKAAEILAATRKAIGEKKLDSLKTLSVEAKLQRNAGNFRAETDVEMLLEMPDKYLRSDTMGGPMGGRVLATGFNGDRAILPSGMRMSPAGGGMVMTMTFGGPGGAAHEGEKPTPEQLEQMNASSLRTYRQEISRLMLGWFGAAHPSLNAQYTYVGEAESPDGKAYVIDAKDADGFAARLFIDQNSKLPLMVTYQGRQRQVMTSGGPGGPGMTTRVAGEQRPTQQLSEEEVKKLREQQEKQIKEGLAAAQQAQMVEYSLFFDDWKEADGINFPHTIRRASEGTTQEEWTVNRVKVNPKIDARKFAVETR